MSRRWLAPILPSGSGQKETHALQKNEGDIPLSPAREAAVAGLVPAVEPGRAGRHFRCCPIQTLAVQRIQDFSIRSV
jgi:hypothetical protein